MAGGSSALSIFQIFSGKRVWFTVKAQVYITGFSVSAGSLYVQDGPVLSGWDLTQGGCFAAINLVTQKSWAIPPDATPATQPPASLYVLPAASEALQTTLMAARLADSRRSSERALLAAANETLANATAAARTVVFSAPAVRSIQLDGLPGGQIFSLGLDGTLIALDDTLAHVGTFKHEAPLRAELALSEVIQISGHVLCHLHYVTKAGGIASLDAMKSTPLPLQAWPGTGIVAAEKVLPLRFQDGLLWGGGILDADFFATAPDPTLPLMLEVPAPAGGWRTYELSTADKLVLVSNGTDTRLVSYDKSAKVRDRWRLRTSSTCNYPVFWTVAGMDTSDATPRLILEVERTKSNQSALGFRVLLANTMDSPRPALATNYPPQVQPLDEGCFVVGDFPTLQTILAIVGRPIVALQTLYVVISGQRAATGAAQELVLAAFALAPELPAVLPKAQNTLATLRALTQPIRLRITRTDKTYPPKNPYGCETKGPYPLGESRLPLTVGTTNLEVATDGLGIAELDIALAGRQAGVNQSQVASWRIYMTCSTTTLQPGILNEVEVVTSNQRL